MILFTKSNGSPIPQYRNRTVQNGQPVLKNKGDMEVIYAPINDILVPVRILIKLGSGVIELRLKKILE